MSELGKSVAERKFLATEKISKATGAHQSDAIPDAPSALSSMEVIEHEPGRNKGQMAEQSESESAPS
jgi:hypothetical protein